MMLNSTGQIGDLLKHWRQKRRFSQLDLACEAGISTRHLSFLETGRSTPSREMLLNLAEQLEVPLRERNALLLAAGFAPLYPQRSLESPEMSFALAAVKHVLKAHEPFPALAIDRYWNLIDANRALAPLMSSVSAALLAPPVNVMKLALHPDGIARRIVNFDEWREHLLARLRHQIDSTADPQIGALLEELLRYPPGRTSHGAPPTAGIAVPLRLSTDAGVLSFLSTTMVFGAPLDVTLSELAIEVFLPADPQTSAALTRLAGA
jgi:transcriptional regulator with XRE-family HTH domain